MSSEPQWRFRKMGCDEPGIDPVQEEFFATEELEDLNGALVREAIQNSLDARGGNEPVEVVFTFGHLTNCKEAIDKTDIFRGLSPHLRAKTNKLAKLPSPVEGLDFIAVEDFGTFGLRGDPRIYDDSAPNMADEHFYYFWRNIGRSRLAGGTSNQHPSLSAGNAVSNQIPDLATVRRPNFHALRLLAGTVVLYRVTLEKFVLWYLATEIPVIVLRGLSSRKLTIETAK